VLVFVAGALARFPHRIPTPDLLRQVGDACTFDPVTGRADRKPITAVLDPAFNGTYTNIRPVSVVNYAVRINGMTGIPTADFANAVKPAIENYFLGREPYIRGLSDDNNKLDTVSRNNVPVWSIKYPYHCGWSLTMSSWSATACQSPARPWAWGNLPNCRDYTLTGLPYERKVF